MADLFMSGFISQYNFIGVVILVMIGLYAMIVKNNLIKKIIGMNIFQSAIILFYISAGAKKDATIPIIMKGRDVVHAADYINPLPHVLMLTAIVVAVATLGVALALAMRVYLQYNTLEEDEILDIIRKKDKEITESK
ncbi:MAG: cation:proton antiporter subunit C [Desulfobulbaceae bacterium]|nr:cation:proton antiporter subunit C [Desulfobulbaceae bacterium]